MTPAEDLRKAYERWAQTWHRRKVPSGKKWATGLVAMGCASGKGTGGIRQWEGIRLRVASASGHQF